MLNPNKNKMDGNLENTTRCCIRKYKEGYEIWPEGLNIIEKTYKCSTFKQIQDVLGNHRFYQSNKPNHQVTFTWH